eukprot:TRINITY_DN186_c0_g1_i10.p1 TRINITY_DN186_c0_g1~~TRINITY_DN186_c0_g1_i10.p1  ORF type:complete len:149 (-),score=32.95 TRINITY_DN186_c0_g1_i10:268-714(-)
MGSVSLKFSEVKFRAYPAEEEDSSDSTRRIDLYVQVEGVLNVSSHVEDMVRVMLMMVIGEYDLERHVKAIHFVDYFGLEIEQDDDGKNDCVEEPVKDARDECGSVGPVIGETQPESNSRDQTEVEEKNVFPLPVLREILDQFLNDPRK